MCEYNVREKLTLWDSYFQQNKSNKRKNSKYSKVKNHLQPTHNYIVKIQSSMENQAFLKTTKSTTTTTKRVTTKTTTSTAATTTLLDLISDSSDTKIGKENDQAAWVIVELIKSIFLTAFDI